jgi:adenylosuccinate lyase
MDLLGYGASNLHTNDQVSEVIDLLMSAILENGKFESLESIQEYLSDTTDDVIHINRATAEALFNMQDDIIHYGKTKSDYENYAKLLDNERYENMGRQALANENFRNQEEVLKGSGQLLQVLTEEAIG